jgi:hypothetical protein
MSIRLVLILSLVLVSIYADDKAAAPAASKAASSDSKSSGSKDEKKGDKKDSEEKDSKNKMKVGGGLYTTDKVANVKSMKGNRPVSIDLLY